MVLGQVAGLLISLILMMSFSRFDPSKFPQQRALHFPTFTFLASWLLMILPLGWKADSSRAVLRRGVFLIGTMFLLMIPAGQILDSRLFAATVMPDGTVIQDTGKGPMANALTGALVGGSRESSMFVAFTASIICISIGLHLRGPASRRLRVDRQRSIAG